MNHLSNLNSFCRFCKEKVSDNLLHDKNKIKLCPFVINFIIGNDTQGIEPAKVCTKCKRALLYVDREFQTGRKHKSRIEMYSDEDNLKDKILNAEQKYDEFKTSLKFYPHNEEHCDICDQDPGELQYEDTHEN